MKLSIQHNIPDSEHKDLAVSFARYFVAADFSSLRGVLSEDVYIIIYDRERKDGIKPVLDYFKNWKTRVGDSFECEVRWSAQFSQPEIYFISNKYKQAYILTRVRDNDIQLGDITFRHELSGGQSLVA